MATEALLQAHRLGGAIQQAAPKDEGDLKASVRIEGGKYGDRFYVRAGGTLTTRPVREGDSAFYDYANAVEHGTAKLRAEPFFYPTYRAHRKAIRAGISATALKAAQRYNAGLGG